MFLLSLALALFTGALFSLARERGTHDEVRATLTANGADAIADVLMTKAARNQ
jgi:hypothetical protein